MIKRFILFNRLIAIMMAMLILFSVAVNADYVDMIDYGFGYRNTNNYLSWVNGAGSTITGNYFMWYWAIDSFDPDYTYTFTFRFTSTESIPTTSSFVYLSRQKYSTSQNLESVKCYSNLSRDNNQYIATVKINFGLLGITEFPAYVTMKLNNTIEITTTVNGWGISAEYDPGGSKFIEEYLNQIVNAGSGYPVPDDSTLDSSVNSLNSAEGVVKDKSSSLINSVSSEMSDNLSQAKALSTTLKPAAIQINSIYNSFLSILPSEVKAVFIAVPLLLFVGWLVGRIKE